MQDYMPCERNGKHQCEDRILKYPNLSRLPINTQSQAGQSNWKAAGARPLPQFGYWLVSHGFVFLNILYSTTDDWLKLIEFWS